MSETELVATKGLNIIKSRLSVELELWVKTLYYRPWSICRPSPFINCREW